MSFHTLQSRIAVRACLQRAEIVHAWVPNIWCPPISPMTESSYLRSELSHMWEQGGSINVDRNHFTYHPGYYLAWRI
jgi:hypothetical protein